MALTEQEMMPEPEVPRRYYKLLQAAEILGVAPSAIRFYDDEIGLRLHRDRHGNRNPTAEQFEQLKAVVGLCALLKLEAVQRMVINNVDLQASLVEINKIIDGKS